MEEEEPVPCGAELRAIEGCLKGKSTHNLSLVTKKGGFAVRFGDVDERPAKGWQIHEVCTFAYFVGTDALSKATMRAGLLAGGCGGVAFYVFL